MAVELKPTYQVKPIGPVAIKKPQFAIDLGASGYTFKDGSVGSKSNFTKYSPDPYETKSKPMLNFGYPVSGENITNYVPPTPTVKKEPVMSKITSAIVPKASAYDLNDEDVSMLDEAVGQGYSQDEALNLLNEYKQSQGVDIYAKTEQPAENLPGLDVGVKVGQGVSDFGKGLKFDAGNSLQNSKNPFAKSFSGLIEAVKFVGNVPGDTIQLVGDLGQAISNPIGTAKSVKTLAEATVETGLNNVFGTDVYTSEDKKQMIEGVSKALNDNFGSLEKIQKTIIENPTDVLLTIQGGLASSKNFIKNPNTLAKIDKVSETISPINILKTEGKLVTGAVKKVGNVTGELGAQVLGKTTGTSAETIKQAFKQGGTKEFQKALKGDTTPEDILGQVKQGLEEIRIDKNKLYGEGAKVLKSNKKEIVVNDIQDDLINTLKNEYKVGILDDGTLDFSQSKITGSSSKSNIQNMYDDLLSWKDKTPDGLDTLKQRIQDYYRGVEDSGNADRLSTILSNKIKDKIIKEVPEYKEMVGNYEKVTNDLKDITKTLSLGKNNQTQTALTKLNSILRDNFTARQDVVKLIEQYTGKNIQGQVAGASLNPMLAKGLAGVITGGGIIFGQLANPAFWGGLAFASPRLIGEIAKTVGVTSEKLNRFITNVKKYRNTTSNRSLNNVEGSTKTLVPFNKKKPTNKPNPINNKGFIELNPKLKDLKPTIKDGAMKEVINKTSKK